MGVISTKDADNEYGDFAVWLAERTRTTDEHLFWLKVMNTLLLHMEA